MSKTSTEFADEKVNVRTIDAHIDEHDVYDEYDLGMLSNYTHVVSCGSAYVLCDSEKKAEYIRNALWTVARESFAAGEKIKDNEL